MENVSTERPSAATEPHWERVIQTPEKVVKAIVYPISCLMPEASNFKANHLVTFPQKEDTIRILVIAGNLSQFSGDLGDALLLHWTEETDKWDHVIFVPGPCDYNHGTIEVGDDYCFKLGKALDKVSILGSQKGMIRCVTFTGPRLVIAGAPMWPLHIDARVYEERRVDSKRSGHNRADAAMAVHDGLNVRVSTLKNRLAKDVADMRMTFEGRSTFKEQETRMIVSYSCPSEALATDEARKGTHVFDATISLGRKRIYDEFERVIDHWIYGANGNKECIGKMGSIITHRNQYVNQRQCFESMAPIFVQRKPMPGSKYT